MNKVGAVTPRFPPSRVLCAIVDIVVDRFVLIRCGYENNTTFGIAFDIGIVSFYMSWGRSGVVVWIEARCVIGIDAQPDNARCLTLVDRVEIFPLAAAAGHAFQRSSTVVITMQHFSTTAGAACTECGRISWRKTGIGT